MPHQIGFFPPYKLLILLQITLYEYFFGHLLILCIFTHTHRFFLLHECLLFRNLILILYFLFFILFQALLFLTIKPFDHTEINLATAHTQCIFIYPPTLLTITFANFGILLLPNLLVCVSPFHLFMHLK